MKCVTANHIGIFHIDESTVCYCSEATIAKSSIILKIMYPISYWTSSFWNMPLVL
jgi:hypothetical protein